MKQREAALQSRPLPPSPLPLTADVADRLQTYVSLLRRWNQTIRLISGQDMAEVWKRHIEDALQLVPLMPQSSAEAVDLGSGGGLPGLVLAIATGVHFDLIESDSRKAAFLREAAIATAAPVTVHARRIEEVTLPPRFLVTARALAPLPRLLDWAQPFLAEGGACLFPKGERAEAEIAEAEARWIMSIERIPSVTAPGASLLRIRNIQPKVPPP